jgi:hypothetical protein
MLLIWVIHIVIVTLHFVGCCDLLFVVVICCVVIVLLIGGDLRYDW